MTRSCRASLVLVLSLCLAELSALVPPIPVQGAPLEQIRTDAPPLPGPSILDDSLLSPGALRASEQADRWDASVTPEGFRLRALPSTTANAASVPVVGLQFSEGEVAVDVRFPQPRADTLFSIFLVTAGDGGPQTAVQVQPTSQTIALRKFSGGSSATLAELKGVSELNTEEWLRLAVRRRGDGVWVLLNDKPILSAEDPTYGPGRVSLVARRNVADTSPLPAVALLRNLRVSSIQDGRAGQHPSLASTPISVLGEGGPPMSPLDSAKVEQLAPAIVLEAHPCPSGLSEARVQGTELTLTAHGICHESMGANSYLVGAGLRGVTMRDGELRFELGSHVNTEGSLLNVTVTSAEPNEYLDFRVGLSGPVGSIAHMGPAGQTILAVGRSATPAPAADVRSIAIRSDGGSLWLLVNDKVLASTTNAPMLDGPVSVILLDPRRSPGQPPISTAVRAIQLTPLASGARSGAPRLTADARGRSASTELLSRAVGKVVLQDTLAASGALEEDECDSALAESRFTAEGLRLSVRGGCDSTDDLPAFTQYLRGLSFGDGEIQMEIRGETNAQRGTFLLGVRGGAGRGYYFALDLEDGSIVVDRVEGDVAWWTDLATPPNLLEGWHTLTLRAEGSTFVLLIDGVAVAAIQDDAYDRGGVLFALIRGGDEERRSPDDREEVAVLVRNLRVSELTPGDPARAPTYAAPTASERAALPPSLGVSGPPPAVGAVIIESPLIEPGLLGLEWCPNGKAEHQFGPDGLTYIVRGLCREESSSVGLGSGVRALELRDGEIRFEMRAVRNGQRALVWVDVRENDESVYSAGLDFGRQSVFFVRADDDDTQVLTARSGVSLPQEQWVTVAVRADGPNLWLLVNDEPMLSVAGAEVSTGQFGISVVRLGERTSEDEVRVQIRNLRISALQGVEPPRAPQPSGPMP